MQDKDPLEAAEEIIKAAASGHWELEQYAAQNAHIIGSFWQALSERVQGPPEIINDIRLELTRLYAVKLLFGDKATVKIDA